MTFSAGSAEDDLVSWASPSPLLLNFFAFVASGAGSGPLLSLIPPNVFLLEALGSRGGFQSRDLTDDRRRRGG